MKAISDGRQFTLMEALARAVAEELVAAVPRRAGRKCACGRRRAARRSRRVDGRDGRDRRLTTAYVGLGANLGDRRATIERAVELLGAAEGVEVLAVSSLRETDPSASRTSRGS